MPASTKQLISYNQLLKDKIMDDKIMKNYFVVNHFVFWGCGLSALGS